MTFVMLTCWSTLSGGGGQETTLKRKTGENVEEKLFFYRHYKLINRLIHILSITVFSQGLIAFI